MAEAGTHSNSRQLLVLFWCVAAATLGAFGSFTVASVVAVDLGGSGAWGGAAWAAGIGGSAVGAMFLGRVIARVGRRNGLVAGWTCGLVGGGCAAAGAEYGLLVLVLVGLAGIGIGHAASGMARFAAADLAPPERRGAAMGKLVWANALGAVAGPAVLGPAGRAWDRLGDVPETGGFALCALTFLVAPLMAATLLPGRTPASAEANTGAGTPPPASTARPFHRTSRTHMGLVALIGGQMVMVLVMSMTPVHLAGANHDLSTVGRVMSMHFVGMFAFAPVAGYLVDRFGPGTVIRAGLVLIALAASLAPAMPVEHGWTLSLPLLLLGLGWCTTFVATSSIFASDVLGDTRSVVQGRADALTWTGSALASISSGGLLAWGGYELVGAVGTGVAIATFAYVLSRRPVPTP